MKTTKLFLIFFLALLLTGCAQRLSEQDRAYLDGTREIAEQARDMAAQAQQDAAYAVQSSHMAAESAQRSAVSAANAEEKVNRMMVQGAKK